MQVDATVLAATLDPLRLPPDAPDDLTLDPLSLEADEEEEGPGAHAPSSRRGRPEGHDGDEEGQRQDEAYAAAAAAAALPPWGAAEWLRRLQAAAVDPGRPALLPAAPPAHRARGQRGAGEAAGRRVEERAPLPATLRVCPSVWDVDGGTAAKAWARMLDQAT